MKKILLALAAGLLTLGACSSTESPPSSESPPPAATPAVPAPEPVDPLAVEAEEIGMSETYEDCDSGDMAACDEIFLGAPLGSDLEEWGDNCGPAGNPSGGWCDENRTAAEDEVDTIGDLDAAGEFEVELLVAFVFIDDATMEEACDWVDTLGSDAYATEFANYYESSMTSSSLPYNHEGAASAFDTWCSI